MARQLGRLKALTVARLKTPGYYADGGGLYLQVTVSARDGEPAKSWVYRYMLHGKAREMGLGSLNAISLQQARGKALDCRRLRQEGTDPIEARKAGQARLALEAAKAATFQACAESYIKAHAPGWRNAKHASQWANTLRTYAYPVIGALPVEAIDTALVTQVLEPIWTAKTETATRLRQRIERVLDWAKVHEYRDGDNPARWRGHLENLLPKRFNVQPVEHHPALPYAEIGAFMSELRAQDSTAARALEFTILTAARTDMTIGARWVELDLAGKTWVVPAARTKTGEKEHRVPLSAAALAIVERMKPLRDGDFLFPGARRGKPLSSNAMLKALARTGRGDLTVHGFRSTFRDWAAELTNFSSEVVEKALAHTISNDTEAAYRRGDLFEKRRRLMQAWAGHCATVRRESTARGNVTAIGHAAR